MSDHTPEKQAGPQQGENSSDGPLQQALPYIVPYAVFAVFTIFADYLPHWRATIYAVKTVAVAATLWYYRSHYREIYFRLSKGTVAAVIIGLLVIVAWVGLDPWYPQSGTEWSSLLNNGFQRFEHTGKVAGQFNPFSSRYLLPPWLAVVFRLLGAIIIVPIFEELFVRSWLLRFLIRGDFQSVPVGAFTWGSFIGTVLFFGLTHHEWLAALLCGAAFNLLLYWQKDLFQCIVAHVVANLALAAWVVSQGAWQFW